MSAQTVLPGRAAPRIDTAMKRLADQRVMARLWERDASLWTADASVRRAIVNRLGWLTIPRIMAQETASLRRAAQELHGGGFRHALLLGMGGSSLFAEVCRRTFGVAPDGVDVTVLDTTDPTAIRSAQAARPLKELLAIVSSKSGTTSEVQALSAYFLEVFRERGEAGAHCLAITDAGTPLEARAASANFRHQFIHRAGRGLDVGGRFSALTYFGLVPAALLGIDVDRLLERAIAMLDRCAPAVALAEHPAAQVAAALSACAVSGRGQLILLASPALESFGTWVEQLVAESTGKAGKGIAPIWGEPVRATGSGSEGRVFVELQLASEVDAPLDRQVRALADAGEIVVRIRWEDRYDLGEEIIKWEIATTLLGWLLDLNPFDEPNVQESKDRTKALLSQYANDGRLPEEPPLCAAGPISVYGAASGGRAPASLSEALAGWLQQLRAGEYAAVLSFLPRREAIESTVQALRRRLGDGLGCATMLGIGPRYLHSTGQLYKGGPDAGIFLLLTADEREDMAIPGAPHTFGVLKHAQALGDVQAMRQRHRRLLHVHLGPQPDDALEGVAQALDGALASATRHA